ncbi:hypothetical protein BH18CHL2_BH18CHL2_12560 [soil metagenome]
MRWGALGLVAGSRLAAAALLADALLLLGHALLRGRVVRCVGAWRVRFVERGWDVTIFHDDSACTSHATASAAF